MASIFNQPHFQDADKAREYLESQVWPAGRICPHCGSVGEHYSLKGKTSRPGLYKCADCRAPFTVTVGTVFERSKVGLHIWLQAVHLMAASKKGISAKQLERMLGVTYKTAWFMAHRLREAMNMPLESPMGGDGGPVEVDETYWGNVGKNKPGHRGGEHKMKIVSLVERNTGKKVSVHVPTVTAKTMKPVLAAHVSENARLMTDEAKVYVKLGNSYFSHETVNHSKEEYARGDVTTNNAEGSFSILKRGLTGTFHSVSEQHLQRYCHEFDFRWNYRIKTGYDDVQRMQVVLQNIAGKRLTYRRPDAS
jgi:transposase-like protein